MLKKFFNIFGFFLLSYAVVFGLTACQNKEEFKVEFMVQDTENNWTVLQEEKVVKGSAELPEAPEKTYYTFAGWFSEEALSTKFENSNIKANVKAYAKYTPNQVKVTINGKDEGTKNIIDVVNATYNPGEGLKFDGWYKDSACEVQWDGKEDVSELFANSVALITYHNGAEELTTEIVKPGSIIESPKTRLEDEVTFESKYIVKDYMSKYDIDYVDENGDPVDFSKPITKSMNITVLWNTVGLTGFQKLSKSTEEHYYINMSSQFEDAVQKAPAVSFRNKITVEQKEGEETTTNTYTVDYIYCYTDCLPNSVKTMIFGEGIKAISHFNGGSASGVEEIKLPSTLKILDNSFNNMPNLKGVKLPQGLEVLIGSFFVERFASTVVSHTLAQTNNNYEIEVPDSVKNISMMPNNLKFSHTKETAQNGDFYKDTDGRIYLKDERGLILVVDPAAVTGKYDISVVGLVLPKAGTIVVPEGVAGIQVGTYMTVFDYLVMPKSFKFINHNANIEDYAEFYDVYNELTTDKDGNTQLITRGGNVLFDENQYKQYIDPSVENFRNDSNISFEGLSLTTNVGGYGNLQWYGYSCGSGIVSIPTAKDARPEGIDMAFLKGSYYYNALPNLDQHINYANEVNTVYLTALLENPTTFLPAAVNLKLEGIETISYAAVKEAIIAAFPMAKEILANCKSFEIQNNGVKVEDNTAVTGDMFLTAEVVNYPKLVVSSSWKVGYTGSGYSKKDYEKPAEATNFKTGDFVFVKKDITGMTAETLKEEVLKLAIENALEDFYVSTFATPEVGEANLRYLFEHATIEFKVNGEVVDPSTITLDNGDVKLEVVW